MIDALPKTAAGKVITNQLAKSATSVGANYRAACRGRSKPEFISKIRIVIEEIDECCYWLELIIESKMISEKLILPLHKEANELTAILFQAQKPLLPKIIDHKSSICNPT